MTKKDIDRSDYPDLVPDPLNPPDGYKKLDCIENRLKYPPKIAWGLIYQSWSDEKKIDFLEKFGASMNHAADLLQNERNALLRTCDNQEKQIIAMAKAEALNRDLLQRQITEHNTQMQELNKTVVSLHQKVREQEAEIKRLKSGN